MVRFTVSFFLPLGDCATVAAVGIFFSEWNKQAVILKLYGQVRCSESAVVCEKGAQTFKAFDFTGVIDAPQLAVEQIIDVLCVDIKARYAQATQLESKIEGLPPK